MKRAPIPGPTAVDVEVVPWKEHVPQHMAPHPLPAMKAVIVEDERSLADLLQNLLAMRHPQVQVLGIASAVDDALELVTRHRPDLLFLDIGLRDGVQGFSVLEQLGPSAPRVIVTTASADHAVSAFRFDAVDYLLKPIDVQALDQALARVAERLRPPGPREEGRTGHRVWWEVPTATGFTRVRVQDIVVASAEGSYTLLHLAGQPRPMTISRALGEVEKELGPGFLRTHRSHLVNPAHVRDFIRPDGERLHLSNGNTVPIARDRVQEVLQRLREEG